MPSLEEGLAAFEARNYTKAFELLKPFAEQGNAEAQCMVANIYQLGLGSERSDLSGLEAIKWCIRSAEQGYGVASNNLAEIYRGGSCGVAADQAEAEKWYLKAREQGFSHTRHDFLSKSP